MMKNKNVPKIRFKGFVEEWEEKRFEEVIELFSGLTYSPSDIQKDEGTLVLRSSNVKEGMIVNADNVYVNSDVVNSDNVRLGDIIVVVRNGSRSLIGKHALIDKVMDNTVIGAFMTGIRYKNPMFINALLSTKQFDYEIGINLGATINQITNGAFKSMQFYIVKNDTEQTHIGNFFQNIDNLINLNQKKLEKLKNFKKASLEKMFPKKGATTPEIRFKGFSGEWEEKKIGDLGTIITGSTPTTLDSSNYGGAFLFVSPADIQENRYIEQTLTCLSEKGFKQGRQLDVGAILFVSIGSTIGKVAQLTQIATTNQQINSIIPNENIKSDFAFSLFSNNATYIKSFAATQAVPILNKTNFSNIEIRVSNDLGEQINIGSYFKRLDNLIFKQQAQLTKLKNIKKACLDKMFVTKE